MEQPTTDLVRRGRRLSAHRIAVDVEARELLPWAGHLLAHGYRLALVAAHHDLGDTTATTAMRVVYLFASGPPDSRIELHLCLDADAPTLPTLAELSFPAGRFEREMRDLYGIVPLHHPLPRRRNWSACTTTSPTSAPCATTSATPSSTPTPNASANACCA